MGETTFDPIEIPPLGENGYSNIQRDDLLRGLSAKMNWVGDEFTSTINQHCENLSECQEEIKQIKIDAAKKSHDAPCDRSKQNTRWIRWIVGTLAGVDALQVGSIAYLFIQNGG